MTDRDYYGLEMLWKLERSNVVTKADLLMVFVHWYLTKQGFRNVGVGDDKTLNDNLPKSELLPEGWNGGNEMYALRYTFGSKLYILHGTVSNGTMIINLLLVKTLKVSNAAFDLEATVNSVNGDTIQTMITEVDKQISRLKNELEAVISDGAPQMTGAQALATAFRRTGDHRGIAPRSNENRAGLVQPSVGQADLDPLGRLGAGMLIDPYYPVPPPEFRAQFPSPPGARFDPFGPNLNRFNRPGPDNDHLNPPGYDDMFM